MANYRDLNDIKRREQELLLQNELIDKKNQELLRGLPSSRDSRRGSPRQRGRPGRRA
jgi:hypothetical protein